MSTSIFHNTTGNEEQHYPSKTTALIPLHPFGRQVVLQFFSTLVLTLFIFTSASAEEQQFGFGYGVDIRGRAHLEQVDLFYRFPLSYSTDIAGMSVKTSLEAGFGLVEGSQAYDPAIGRFSLTPEVILQASQSVDLIFGAGIGFMAGNTTIDDHELGGPLLFTGKIGVQYHFNTKWGLEGSFYHQSNAHIYTANYSLNMCQLAVTYTF